MVIDKKLLDKVSEQAKASPRLRMNYNFHQSLDEKCDKGTGSLSPGSLSPAKYAESVRGLDRSVAEVA